MRTILEELKILQDENYDMTLSIPTPDNAILQAKLLAQSLIPLVNRDQIGYIAIINERTPAPMIIDALNMLGGRKPENVSDDAAWHIYNNKNKIILEIDFILRLQTIKLLLS